MFKKIKQIKYRSDVSSYLHLRLGIGRNALARITEVNSGLLNEAYDNDVSIPESGIRLSLKCAVQTFLSNQKGVDLTLLNSIYGETYGEAARDLGKIGAELLFDGTRNALAQSVICLIYNRYNQDIVELVDGLASTEIISKDVYNELKRKGSADLSDIVENEIQKLPNWIIL